MPTRSLLARTLARLLGHHRGRSYEDVLGPRYAAACPIDAPGACAALRVVTFNVEFSRRVNGAIALLKSDPALCDADVVLLQEMDHDGTARIAHAMDMGYVYYPSVFHGQAGKDFGNAVLSRWPVATDAKLVLPHPSRLAGTHRTATVATLRVAGTHVRVYSTHLGTPLDVSAARRREQLWAVFADAAPHPAVIIGGDLNEQAIGWEALAAGYAWPTREGPRTVSLGRWDHLFFRGLRLPETGASGTGPAAGPDARRVSDHRPVWAVGLLG
jgi:endonuclease/exonuclease/phosphatase family metal-dependent hydrolase